MGLPDRKWTEKLFFYMTEGLIILHLLLTLFYALSFVPLMLVVNLACVLSCTMAYLQLKKEHIRSCILILYITEMIQLIISAVCVGFSAGFQLPLVGVTAMVFLGEYLGRSMKLPYLPALPLGIINLAVYLLAFLYFFHRPGLLGLSQSTALQIEILWSIPTFALLIWGMYTVVQLSSVSEHSLANKAETDELTGLLNRAGYDRLLEELDMKTVSLLLVDTDKFKGINDTYGHSTGDQVLKKISTSLLGNFRQNDHVCRIGGDEFAVLMLNAGTLADEKIIEKIGYINRELAGSIEDELPAVSVSVGAAHGTQAESWKELFEHADTALYQVKQKGGRGCRVYTAEQQGNIFADEIGKERNGGTV